MYAIQPSRTNTTPFARVERLGARRHLELDLSNGLGRVQALGTRSGERGSASEASESDVGETWVWGLTDCS